MEFFFGGVEYLRVEHTSTSI